MLNCRLVVDVGNDFDSLNFAPFRLPYLLFLLFLASFMVLWQVQFYGYNVIFRCQDPAFVLNSLAYPRTRVNQI